MRIARGAIPVAEALLRQIPVQYLMTAPRQRLAALHLSQKKAFPDQLPGHRQHRPTPCPPSRVATVNHPQQRQKQDGGE